jgi:hypothetical protein
VLCSGHQANDNLVCSSGSVIEPWLRGVFINPMTLCVHLVLLLCAVFLSFLDSLFMLTSFLFKQLVMNL